MASPTWLRPFLTNLTRTGNVSKSAGLAGISSASVYALKRTDADFAAAWDTALEDHTDECEAELTRRAFGYEEPVVYQGQLTPVWQLDGKGNQLLEAYTVIEPKTGKQLTAHRPIQAVNADGSLRWLTVTKFSDTLLLARVKAYRKRYSTDRTEITGGDGGAVQVDATARRARIASIMALASARADGDHSDVA